TFSHPGEVKVGPDNLLYVLNNGDGDQALYIMKPDGEVVRKIALNGKTPPAAGLGLGLDGQIYVTDMGLVRKYSLGGGEQVTTWGGANGSFKNVWGLAIDRDGTIYVAETGSEFVHQFDQHGQFIRSYNVHCYPAYIAIAGDWLDVSCHRGLR